MEPRKPPTHQLSQRFLAGNTRCHLHHVHGFLALLGVLSVQIILQKWEAGIHSLGTMLANSVRLPLLNTTCMLTMKVIDAEDNQNPQTHSLTHDDRR